MEINKIICGDALEELKKLPDESIDCCISSPPYWSLRDYGVSGQLGLEKTFEEYIEKLCRIYDEIKRVLKKEGTCFVNLGDTYGGTGSGHQNSPNTSGKQTFEVYIGQDKARKNKGQSSKQYEKSLLMIPSRFALEMINRGWKLRNVIVWHKKNAMPSSILDRFTNKYEQIFFFTKSKRYYFDLDSVRVPFETEEKNPNGLERNRQYNYDLKFNVLQAEKFSSPRVRISRKFNSKEGTKDRELENNARKFNIRRPAGNNYQRNSKGKNPGDVWTTISEPLPEAHFATYPTKLLIPMIKAGVPKGGIVLDQFMGSGTTALVAKRLNRNYLGIELNPSYIKISEDRLRQEVLF